MILWNIYRANERNDVDFVFYIPIAKISRVDQAKKSGLDGAKERYNNGA